MNEIKSARKACKLSQQKLAEMCGVSLRHYQYIETGRCVPGVDVALKIAEALGADVVTLFGEASKKHAPDGNVTDLQ